MNELVGNTQVKIRGVFVFLFKAMHVVLTNKKNLVFALNKFLVVEKVIILSAANVNEFPIVRVRVNNGIAVIAVIKAHFINGVVVDFAKWHRISYHFSFIPRLMVVFDFSTEKGICQTFKIKSKYFSAIFETFFKNTSPLKKVPPFGKIMVKKRKKRHIMHKNENFGLGFSCFFKR